MSGRRRNPQAPGPRSRSGTAYALLYPELLQAEIAVDLAIAKAGQTAPERDPDAVDLAIAAACDAVSEGK